MQDTVHELFPDYRKNQTLMGMKLYRESLELIDVKVDEGNIEEYNAKWLEICKRSPGGL
jgi:hypothetical protein